MIDAAQLKALAQNERQKIGTAWEVERKSLQVEFPTRVGNNRTKYENAGFASSSSFEIDDLAAKAQVGTSSTYNFVNGASVGFKIFEKLMKVFEPLVTGDEILAKALGAVPINTHQSFDADHNDGAAVSLSMKFDMGRFQSIGPTIILRDFGDDVPNLGMVETVGIPPDHITLRYSGVQFDDFDDGLVDQEFLEGLRIKGRKNSRKFSLVGIEPEHDQTEEGQLITLNLQRTDFHTIVSCLARIGNVEDPIGKVLTERSHDRAKYGAPIPSLNRVPNSLCLHYILRFADNKFLAIHRHEGMAYDKLKVSISGEEQILEADFKTNSGMSSAERWAYRAVVEEVLPGRGYDVEATEIQQLTKQVALVRYLGLIYEERFCNFAMVALIQLKCSVKQYVDIYRDSLGKVGKTDYEGNRYWFSEKDLRIFFQTGRLALNPFVEGQDRIFAATNAHLNVDDAPGTFGLHSSSLYRLLLAKKLSGM